MNESSDAVIKSVARVFEVIELFAEMREPLTTAKVCRQLGYPQSSTLALLKSMVRLGYLYFDNADRTYFPTMRILILGHWLESSIHGEADVLGLMNELSAATGETVALSSENDLDMQFVHITVGTEPFALAVRPGSIAPLFVSGIGIMALSHYAEVEIRELAQRYAKAALSEKPLDIDAVLRRVGQARAAGHYVSYDSYIASVGAVCWLLPTITGKRPLVISVSGPSERIRFKEAEIVKAGDAAIRRSAAKALHATEAVRRNA